MIHFLDSFKDLFNHLFGRQSKSEIFHLPAPPQRPSLRQVEAGRQGLRLGLPRGWQGPPPTAAAVAVAGGYTALALGSPGDPQPLPLCTKAQRAPSARVSHPSLFLLILHIPK